MKQVLAVYAPTEIIKRVRDYAKKEGRSASNWVLQAVREKLATYGNN